MTKPRLITVAAVLIAASAILAGACGAGPTPTPEPPVQSGRAETVEGPFRLVFEMPQTVWREGDAITGSATLSLIGAGSEDLGGSGQGLFGFDFLEVGGSRHMQPGWTADCAPCRLDAARPIASDIRTSGGLTAEDPNAAFYRSFLTDPLVHLPAGDWRITAVASFVEGRACTGQSHTIQAPILIHVVP